MSHGLVEDHISHNLEYLDVIPLCTFQKKEEKISTISQRSVYSLDTKTESKDTSCGIHLPGLQCKIEM